MLLATPETFSRESPEPLDGGLDESVLALRQIRLYIENSPWTYPLAVAVVVVSVAVLLWPYLPDKHPNVLLWAGLLVVGVLVRVAAWLAYSRARPDDRDVRRWLKWFFVPQFFALTTIGAGPFFFLPGSSGHDSEIVLILTIIIFTSGFASMKLSAYRPLIATALTPMVVIYVAGVLRVPGIVPMVSALGALGTGLFGYLLASRLNQAFVRSMELTIRNERLVAALEVRSAQLQQQTHAAEKAQEAAEEARYAAESAERDKTRFLAAASHDLRQPMHAISLLVGMLRPRAQAAEREVVERLERSVESMDTLFSAILDLSKLDAGVMKPVAAAVPLRAIFDSIEVHFAPQAALKKIALEVFPTRAVVETDRAVLERLLRNLVSNAIKYTREGKVLVGCRRHGERLCVGVWDTGIGIAAENLERIFEEYFQAGSGSRDRSEGLGLGLSIVRRLARLLGTEIEVRSAPGRGSRFALEIPFAGYGRSETQSRVEVRAPDDSLAGKYVLVVDDEADVRFGTEALLRQWGCHSASAGTLDEVAELLERELRFPDAVITDYRIAADRTGVEVISEVQRHTGEQTPGIIVTGEDLGSAEVRAGGGAYAIVKKPLAAEELRRRLIAVLGATPELERRTG